MTAGLAGKLRAATRALHGEVEYAGIMADLVRGRVEPVSYCELLRNLHALYEALEGALQRLRGETAISGLCLPALFRQEAIAADLRVLHGERWRSELALLSAARRYVARLRRLEGEEPLRLIAHAYIRYLGDLSGGQILRRVLAPALERGGGEGMRFYEYPGIADIDACAQRYRAALDAIDVDQATTQAILEEACLGFRMHAAMFRELAARAEQNDARGSASNPV